MNSCKYRLFLLIKGLLAMRCAVFRREGGRHCPEVPGVSPMKTVVGAMKTVAKAMKTVAKAMKTVVAAIMCQIPI